MEDQRFSEPIDGQEPGGDRGLELREGGTMTLTGGPDRSTFETIRVAMLASLGLGGKVVHCTDVVPGVSMRAEMGTLRVSGNAESLAVVDELWQLVRPELVTWLVSKAAGQCSMRLNHVIRFVFQRGEDVPSPGTSFRIAVQHDLAFARAYAKRRRKAPLVEARPVHDEQADEQGVELRRLLVETLEKTGGAFEPRYQRFPVLVLFRCSGALAAWQRFQAALEARAGNRNLSRLVTTRAVSHLYSTAKTITTTLLPKGKFGASPNEVTTLVMQTMTWHAFEANQGALYEPTPAMHRLLSSTYIADDVPIGMLQVPGEVVAIIPEPSEWDRRDGNQAIVMFKRPSGISCVAWSRAADATPGASIHMVELATGDPQRTIHQVLLDAIPLEMADDDGAAREKRVQTRQHWEKTLDYALKMLLYLSVGNACILVDRAYSNAQREFKGLGKRKRAQRQSDIDAMYDRHIVGPAVLHAEAAVSMETGSGREVSSHWRRPHFAMQPYGPLRSLRKLIFIGPIIVRPDRIGQA
ncbi:hypothetical protein L3V59_36240 [Burkholderia aenigmatica]|uniref:hypothetical protein n=1 Tax=Burkholderia aenigmatica TaxID=2015348 RepID=UPI001F48CE81|nr:hypothetical protein [Burkholderia aenigmatica]UKD17396.1 hypothetical protein L3V59_36240 [Burkholderia aenigmatica]